MGVGSIPQAPHELVDLDRGDRCRAIIRQG
jgi:hypothetical protein